MEIFNIEIARAFFLKNQCILISDKYKNSKEKLDYICICGNSSRISFSNFKLGHRCRECARKKQCFNQKFIETYMLERGCKLLSTYINNSTPVRYKCSCGKESRIQFKSFRKGGRCQSCKGNKISKSNRLDGNMVKDYFAINGCELLSEYTTAGVRMDYRCICGNLSKISYNKFKRGSRCRSCLPAKLSGENNGCWIKDRKEAKMRTMFRRKCYGTLSNVLKRLKQSKDTSSSKLLGYSVGQLREHIEKHPNWEYLKDKDWHLDHIYPIKAFTDYNISDVKLINCLENLRPLSPTDNVKKSSKYNLQEFRFWLETKGINI